MQIWKFPLKISPNQIIRMPFGCEILSLQVQDEIPCLWALCDENVELIYRRFYTYGTGHSITNEIGEFIGTYQLPDRHDIFVGHLFEGVYRDG